MVRFYQHFLCKKILQGILVHLFCADRDYKMLRCGIVEVEGAMYASKVQIVCGNSKCEKYNKGTRIKHEIVDGKKIRVCAKCGKEL